MHQTYEETVEKLKMWACQERAIHGVILLGSQVRQEFAGDEWSDLDVLLLVDNPQFLFQTDIWLTYFGETLCMTVEESRLDWLQLTWTVKRVLFTDNRVVDFSILPYDRVDDVLSLNAEIHVNGYQVIYEDHANLIASKIGATLANLHENPLKVPTEDELNRVVSSLLFYLIYASKKIKRNELWVAVSCINQQVSALLLELIEYHIATISKNSNRICYEGRFLEQRIDPGIQAELSGCFTKYVAEDAIRTVGHVIETTRHLTKDICEENSYPFEERLFERTRDLSHEIFNNSTNNIL
jgi:aminoglycoside 6-adenylyltransferase